MKNEILEELWKIKDQIAHEYENDIDRLANELRVKEKKKNVLVLDLTNKTKQANVK